MLTRHHIPFVSLLLIDIVFFSITHPFEASTLILLGGFLLIVSTWYALIRSFVQALRFPKDASRRRLFIGLSTGVFAFITALQSVGLLSVRDILAVMPLVLVGYFYLSFFAASKSTI